MRKTSLAVLLLPMLLVVGSTDGAGAFATPSPAPSVSAGVPFVLATDLQRLLNERVAQSPGVGIIVGVVDNGKTSIYIAGSSGTKRRLDEHTLFEIGSVTKTFTATILASMVLSHDVALDDPVSKYLPASVNVPQRNGKQITLLNLATQHSGLPRLPTNFKPADPANPYADYTIVELYQFLDSYTLPRDPGEQFEYSNIGVALLGDALANREGLSYTQLLNERVLAPLRMHETVTALTPTLSDRMALGHDGDGNPVKPWTFVAIAPAGAINSSLADMLKYLHANMGQGSLAQACLFAQQPRDTIEGGRIGLVWWTGNRTRAIHHGGDTFGYHAWIAISPDRTKGAVVLTNGGSPVEDLAIHAIDEAFPVATATPVVELDQATLESYVGTYSFAGAAGSSSAITITITLSGDKLMARLSGQDAARIYPSAKDHFFYRVVAAQIDFTRDTSGAINGLALHQNGRSLAFVRSGMTIQGAPPATFTPTIQLNPKTLEEYVGTYKSASGTFAVTLQGEALMVQLGDQPAFEVYASAKDHFYYKVVDAQIDFERDADGRIKDLVLHQSGLTLTADRQ